MYITVTHYKGGVGKTTTAVHLAAYLQQQAPTLFIDGDPVRSGCASRLQLHVFRLRKIDRPTNSRLRETGRHTAELSDQQM